MAENQDIHSVVAADTLPNATPAKTLEEDLFGLDDVPLPPIPQLSEGAKKRMGSVFDAVRQEEPDVWLAQKWFEEPNLYEVFSAKLDDETLKDYIVHTARFAKFLWPHRAKILGEEVIIPASQHANGRERDAQSGPKILLDQLPDNIDPTKVLIFRATQPGGPKPEYYWTTDYFETLRELTVEIPADQRATMVILVSTLDRVNSNGGLIQDINDDQGLAVRQISLEPFLQTNTLAIVTPSHRAS